MELPHFLGGLWIASALLVLVPALGGLAAGGYSRAQHWTAKSGPVAVARSVIALQQLFLPIFAFCWAYGFAPPVRLLAVATALAGWWSGVLPVSHVLRRGHDFPKPTVPFEDERGILLSVLCGGILAAPILSLGTPLPVRLTVSALSLVVGSLIALAPLRVLRWSGLLAEVPPELVSLGSGLPRNVRIEVARSSLPNAYALRLQRVVLVTTGALQVLTTEELEAILAHERAHLDEPIGATFERLAPNGFLLLGSSALALVEWLRHALFIAAMAATFLILGRVVSAGDRRRERRADAAAIASRPGSEAYARALIALHAAYLMPLDPATHPPLLERLDAADARPDSPAAPSPPVPLAMLLTLVVTAFTFVVLFGAPFLGELE